MLAGQIVVQVPYSTAPVCRTRGVRERPGEDEERFLRRSEPRRHVVRIEVRGLDAVVLTPVPSGFFSLPLCHATFLLARLLYTSQDTSMSACQHAKRFMPFALRHGPAGCLLSPSWRLRSQPLCGPASPGPLFPRAFSGRRACRGP